MLIRGPVPRPSPVKATPACEFAKTPQYLGSVAAQSTKRHPGRDMKFPISREARDRYQFDPELFAPDAPAASASFHAARVFTQQMNDRRDVARFPERAVSAGEINALSLIDEIFRLVINVYCEEKNAALRAAALAWLTERHDQAVDQTLLKFLDAFPPPSIYRGTENSTAYLGGATAGVPHRQLVLDDLVLLWLTNRNPATSPFAELFDDSAMAKVSAYRPVLANLKEFFAGQPAFGPDEQNLIDFLRSPAIASPHSLAGQLAFILEKWGYLLGSLLYRILRGMDLIREEEKARALAAGQAHGPGAAIAPTFTGQEAEPERF